MRGDMYANEEKRKKDEQDFLNAQREQTRAQWARDDEERGAIAALDRPGVRPDPQAILDQDFTQNETIPTKTVTDADYARGLARAYKYSPDKALAALNTANQFDQTARTVKQQGRADAALDRRAAMIDQWRKDPQGFLNTYSTAFNSDTFGGPQHAGKTVSFATTPNGMVGHMFDPTGKHVGTMPLTNESVTALINQLTDDDLATVSPEMFGQAAARGIQRGELGAKQTAANAAMKQALTQEQYRADQLPLMQAQARLANSHASLFDRTDPNLRGGGGANGAINNELVKLAGAYAELTPEQQKGPEGQTIMRQAAIIKAKLDPLTVLGDNKPQRPAIGMKELSEFVNTMGGQPSRVPDPKTGKPIPIGQLSPDQIRSYAESFYYGAPNDGGGLPAVKPPSAAPGAPRPTAMQPVGIPSRQDALQAAYDKWQGLKTPWYMPSPRANAEEAAAEQEYLRLLRNPGAR